jgi:hypothetical protein
MANVNIPFTTPGNYTYDSDKIEVGSGIAKLKESSFWQNIMAYYKLNGNVDDELGSQDMTGVGTLNYGSGKLNQSVSVVDQGAYAYVSDNPGLDFSGAFSVSLWVRHTVGDNRIIIQKKDYSVAGQHIGWYMAIVSGKIRWGGKHPDTGAVFFDTDATVPDDGQYHHLVITRDVMGNRRAYIDGVCDINSDTFDKDINNTYPLELCPDESWKCWSYVDEVIIFDKGLNQSEVDSLYASNSPSD